MGRCCFSRESQISVQAEDFDELLVYDVGSS
jgi:hypothetical protein